MLNKFSQFLCVFFRSCLFVTAFCVFSICLSFSTVLAQDNLSYITPKYVLFETVLATQQDGRLEGDNYNVRITILSYDGVSATNRTWSAFYSNHSFVSGVASFVLSVDDDNVSLGPDVFNISNPHFFLEVFDISDDSEFSAYIPLTSVPYAMQAAIAEEALYADASIIDGEFTSDVNISANLLVKDANGDTFFIVDQDSKSVAIGSDVINSNAALDVNGSVNATGFTIDGVDIEETFSWNRNDNVIYFNESNAVVGIGTSTPTSSIIYEDVVYDIVLDVRGTMNVSEILIDQVPILSYLSSVFAWQDAFNEDDIFFDSSAGGAVGIGVSTNLTEQLVVSGAIRLASSVQEVPLEGTIEYDTSDNDFYGYVDDGTYMSLTGVQYDSSSVRGDNEIPYWTDSNSISSTSNFVFFK